MKKILTVTLLLNFCVGLLHAQSVVVSADGNKLSFIIRVSTTAAQIQKADSVFAAHGVTVAVDASRKSNLINDATINVSCDKGTATYHATKESLERNGLTILVDRNKDAKVSLCVGVCNTAQ